MVAPGLEHTVVAIPGGYEAAGYDEQGHIAFWKSAGLSWQKVGTSTYPVLPGEGVSTTVTGALLTGMDDATFIATGYFTGDGSGNTIAFTNGAHGWGTVAPGPGNTLVPTGAASTDNTTPGIELAMRFSGGDLVTDVANSFFDVAEGDAYPLRTYWKWNGAGFADDHDNSFTAQAAPAPIPPPTTLTSCPNPPPDGTYRAYMTGEDPGAYESGTSGVQTLVPDGQVHLLFQSSATFASADACRATVSPTLPMTLRAATRSGGSSWVTAPAWFLAGAHTMANDLQTPGGTPPYVVPPALGITTITSNLGTPLFAAAAQASPPTLTYGSVTFSGGTVTALALLPAP